jgi:hypothetical protein
MNNEDSQDQGTGNTGNTGNRNFGPPKYPEKMPNYSPSTAFNYGHHGGGYSNMQQHPRRRADRFKRESLNLNDKVVKQNDMIIRLLKEIRDRLPLPPAQESQPLPLQALQQGQASADTDVTLDETENRSSGDQDDQSGDFQP